MIAGPEAGDETVRLHFVYDAWNRQVAVHADDGQGQPGDVIVEYSYDGAGRRITKTYDDGAQTEYYYNQDWQMLEERVFDDEAQPVESHVYVWSPRYVDSPILRDSYDSGGTLDADERVYYLNDANFNVTALVGLVEVEPDVFEWQVVERYVYDPYGKTTVYDAEWSTNPQSLIPSATAATFSTRTPRCTMSAGAATTRPSPPGSPATRSSTPPATRTSTVTAPTSPLARAIPWPRPEVGGAGS